MSALETSILKSSKNPTRTIAILAMIGSAACWGLATVMSRDVLHQMSPPALLVVQLVASVSLLLLMAVRERPAKHIGKPLIRASLTGLLEPGLAYTVGLIGLSWTTAGHSAVISSAEPIFILLLGWLLFKQRPSGRLMGCIALAFMGLVLVSQEQGADQALDQMLGDFLIVLATMFAAGYVVLSARLSSSYPPATLAAAQQTAGLVLAIAVYGIAITANLVPPLWNDVSASTLWYAGFSGVVQYAIPFWLYLIGLRVLSAGAAGLYLTLTPLFGLAGAYIWLGEQPHLIMFIGAGLIVGAVLMGRSET
ncbi:DMT family transporter [Phyllobacterium calauticae]|uniref:DMT family transporter n=1 Tax=Phyllobacterium calauticae TaxID=2817027 RepID=UPI001CBD7CE6|nr:DMT family transporter [Phyllobacterium calauticae]